MDNVLNPIKWWLTLPMMSVSVFHQNASLLLKNCILLFLHVSVYLYACLCNLHMPRSHKNPEEGIVSPEIGVRSGCELRCVGWESKLGSPEDQHSS